MIRLKEEKLDPQSISTCRINYAPESAYVENDLFVSYVGFGGESAETPYSLITVTSPIDYGYKLGEMFTAYNQETRETVWCVLTAKTEDTITLQAKPNSIDEETLSKGGYTISYISGYCPTYAVYSESKQEYVWRELLKPSEISSDSQLYSRTFSNGCIYINDNINLFVRRQDPHGVYYMLNYWENPDGVEVVDKLRKVNKWGVKIDLSPAVYLWNDLTEFC